jgi:FAD/FMN-containing dehydrogenase
VLSDNSFQAFGESLRGELIQPGDQRYDTARKLYNGMIDRRPRAIVRCADVSDVITAVSFAREHELLLAVRGGGHNGGGLGSCDDGLVIDLRRMKGVRVDAARRTARVEGGCTRGDVDLHLQRMCGVIWCYTGPKEGSNAAFKPIRDFGSPALYGIQTMAFPVLQSAFDNLYPPDLQWYWKADFVNELSEKAIALHIEHGSRLPTMHSAMNLYPIDGAAHRVGRKDTAFSYQEATWAEVIVGVDPDPAKKERITTWAKEYWDALHPHSAGGAYVNFMMDEGENRVKDSYRDNYHRLAAVKAKFDPTNLFRVNQNVQPASYACRK